MKTKPGLESLRESAIQHHPSALEISTCLLYTLSECYAARQVVPLFGAYRDQHYLWHWTVMLSEDPLFEKKVHPSVRSDAGVNFCSLPLLGNANGAGTTSARGGHRHHDHCCDHRCGHRRHRWWRVADSSRCNRRGGHRGAGTEP